MREVKNVKTYQVNGKSYTEDEVIAVHAMWQDIQDRNNVEKGVELAVAMIGNDEVAEYVRNNEQDIVEQCLEALPEWGVWQNECLSQNCLLYDYLIADKLREMYANYCSGGNR